MVTRFIWPLDDHYITRGFDFVSSVYVRGDNGVRMHAAIDLVRLQGGTLGRDVLAMADGIVVGDAWDMYSGYYIVLEHEGGWRSTYRHLIVDAPPVVGYPIMQGQVIGQVGSTGLSFGPHLHADLWHRQPQDPTAHAKIGWWAHNPELYLGQEDYDMGMTEAEKKHVDSLTAVVDALRQELGLPPAFGLTHKPESGLLERLKGLDKHAANTRYHHLLSEIETAVGGSNGLKRGDKVNIKGGTLE